ncbi:MAG: hypothetical protein KDB87_21730, partial [Flavobacteriales bacterium]|nr:hypothetical protein [Flavobacteriales bacterium]
MPSREHHDRVRAPNVRNEQVRDLTKVLFLDIETVPSTYRWSQLDPMMQQYWDQKTRFRQGSQNMNAADLYREAGIYAEFGRIICIGVGRIEKQADGPHLRVTTLHGDHERDVLERFVDLLDKHYNTDEHWLCGHNGREFDFPFIARRCVVNGLSLPRLLDIAGLKPWEVGHLD